MPAKAKQITAPMRREDLELYGRVIYCLCLLVVLSNWNQEYPVFQTSLRRNIVFLSSGFGVSVESDISF